jgi:hypothetical protein
MSGGKSLAFDGRVEKRDNPGKFTVKEVLEHLEKVKDVRPGKTDITGKKEAERRSKDL